MFNDWFYGVIPHDKKWQPFIESLVRNFESLPIFVLSIPDEPPTEYQLRRSRWESICVALLKELRRQNKVFYHNDWKADGRLILSKTKTPA